MTSEREPADPGLRAAAAWLQFAADDLNMAELGAGSQVAAGWAIGFHCQQAVEKAMKGGLALHGIAPPATHVFKTLCELLIQAGCEPPLDPRRLGLLQPLATRERYPALSLLPISREEAAELLPDARQTVAWLRRMLEQASR